MKKKKHEDEVYRITPKGIAAFGMLQAGLIQTVDDPRIDGFWTIFSDAMQSNGYVQTEEENT